MFGDQICLSALLTARGAPPPLARAPALEDSLSSRGPQALLTARGADARVAGASGARRLGILARTAGAPSCYARTAKRAGILLVMSCSTSSAPGSGAMSI